MATGKTGIMGKAKFIIIGLIIGLLLGIAGTIFIQNHNPKDQYTLTPSVVFERVVQKNELVSASQNYNITDKATGNNVKLFDAIDIPFTGNSFWYRYVGTIKAGVDLSTAEFSQNGTTITISLDQPYIISNTPDMDKSGVLEENNNILNPIHIEDVDKFQRACVEQSEATALEGDLMDEARANAAQDIQDMFNAALGSEYTIDIQWRDAQNE